MKYLDERIQFDITIGGSLSSRPAAGMYTYTIKYKDTSYERYTIIFVGNFYYDRTYTASIDVTDILRNKWRMLESNRQKLTEPNAQAVFTEEDHILECWIEIDFGETPGIMESSHEMIAFIWRYPNRSEYNNSLDGALTYFDGSSTTYKNKYSLLLQGYKTTLTPSSDVANFDAYDLIPHYPLQETNNLQVALDFEVGKSVLSIPLTARDPNGVASDLNMLITNYNQNTIYDAEGILPITLVMENVLYEMDYHQYTPVQDPYVFIPNVATGRNAVVAIFDVCYSRYYLQWKDRFGSYQCQPFKDNGTYSEDISNNEFTTYKDRRRKYNVQVQPKWKIHSGWLSEQNYIYYESILTSPFVYLYDTKTKMGYEVIVNDNWTEKNYKNQKNLLKLELNLEAVEKQNINY